jgi:Tfp pilus assembly protein PilF
VFTPCRKLGHGLIACVRRPRLLVLLAIASIGLSLLIAQYWPETYLYSARKALTRHDFIAARAALEHYLAARPTSAEAHLLLARLDRRGNQCVEAAKHLDECQRLAGSAEAIERERALLDIQNGLFNAQRERICREYLARGGPDEYLILEALSQGLSKTYRLTEAKTCLDRMLELQPDSGYALRRRGWIFSLTHHNDRAEADYRRAVEIDPADTVARLGLAQIVADPAEAVLQFERVWATRKDATVAIGLAQAWILVGRTEEARRLLDDWLAEHPRDVLILTERGKLALSDQQVEQAESFLNRAVAVSPYLLDANHSLYLCLNQQGKKADAERCQKRIKQSEEDNRRLVDLTVGLQQTPDDADLRCRMAEIFLRQGQDQEGERWLLTTLQAHPDHRSSHLALADYYQRIGRIDRADLHRRRAGATTSPRSRKP